MKKEYSQTLKDWSQKVKKKKNVYNDLKQNVINLGKYNTFQVRSGSKMAIH